MYHKTIGNTSNFLFRKSMWIWLGCLWLLSNVAFAQVNIPQAIDYLKAQQNSDGSIANSQDIATSFQASAEAIRAFDLVGEDDAAVVQPARNFINGETYRNTENLARLLIDASAANIDVGLLLAELSLYQNADGGFGEFPGYDSSSIDTAFALEALALSGLASDQLAGKAVGFLLDEQLPSGGWLDASNTESIYKSAIAMRALWHYRGVFSGVTDALRNAQAYLYAQQDAFGLWGEAYQSALVLIALVPNASEYASVAGMVANLASQQKANGSWEDSPYVTALVLRALRSQATPLPVVPTEGSIVGRVLDSNTRKAIANATIQLAGNSAVANSDALGQFELSALTANSYVVTVSAAGYAAVSLSSVNVSAGNASNLGDVLLTSLPSSGIVQGRVTDSATGLALSGVSISVSGAATAMTQSLSDGGFSLVGLAPGDITMTVVMSGYLPVNATATVVAGQSIIFNVAMLRPQAGTNPLPGVPEFGELRGIVLDASTGLPIRAYIQLTIDGGNPRGIFSAASSGAYAFADLIPGNVSVSVSLAGYLAVQASGSIVAGNSTVFNVSMVPQGGDPNSGGSEISTQPLPGVPTTGQISGVVSNAADGALIEGAEILLTGAAGSVSTQTAADGAYLFADVVPGDVSIAVSRPGFITVSANGSVAAGNVVTFSPALLPEGGTADLPAEFIGTVVDASSASPLQSVTVLFENQNTDKTVWTDRSGRFQGSVSEGGSYTVSFSKVGYISQSFSIVLAGGVRLNFDTIQLKRAISEVAVYGLITDRQSGAAISDAVVSVLGSAKSSQTDATGRYRVNGVGVGTHTLIFTATGYASQTLTYDFPEGGEYEVNRNLSVSGETGFKITAMMLDQPSYSAYTDATINVSVLNSGAAPAQASVEFTLYNESNEAVHLFAASFEDANGDAQTAFVFEPGVVRDIPVIWNTSNIPPGGYRLLGRIVSGDVFVGPAKVILAERASNIVIAPTKVMKLLSINALPSFSAVAVDDSFDLQGEILNRSNVQYTFRAIIRLLSPSGEVVYSEPTEVELSPEDDNLLIDLDEVALIFTEPGEYRIELLPQYGVWPVEVRLGTISVAPGIRIDATQSLNPASVTPDEDKQIRLRVRLQGREIQ